MARIEHRTSPEALPSEALLPSQRTLLSLEQPYTPSLFSGLSNTAINQLGEFLAYDLSLVREREALAQDEKRNYGYDRVIHKLGILADRLLSAGPDYDPYEGLDRNQVKIHDTLTVTSRVQDTFTRLDGFAHSELGTYSAEHTVFTPQGFVHNPPENFQQKVIAIDINNRHIFAEDAVFNFSAEGHLYFYTDNLSVDTPSWEFTETDGITDIFPARHPDPYFFHAQPKRIISEDLAVSVVESLARIFDTSTREREQEEATDNARRAASKETSA